MGVDLQCDYRYECYNFKHMIYFLSTAIILCPRSSSTKFQ